MTTDTRADLAAARGGYDMILRELGSDTEPSRWSRNALIIAKEQFARWPR